MLNFRDFIVAEADSSATKIQNIKTDLSKKFDMINQIKAQTKRGDINSEMDGLTKQANVYQEISVTMKNLVVEMKKTNVPGKPQENIY